MRALIVLVLAGAWARPAGACDDTRLQAHARAGHWVDVHNLADVLLSLCPDAPAADGWRVLDALALDRLDERARAREQLAALPPSSPEAPRARTLLAWSYLRDGDDQAYRAVERSLDPAVAARLLVLSSVGDEAGFRARAARLDDELRRAALRAHHDYRRARSRSPALAGVLSALLPGAGQAYGGAWQGAAVSLLLNAVLIGATVELVRHELYFSAGATGLAASVFYVGNIMNAVDGAARKNDVASTPARLELERLLLPEAQK